MSNVLKTPAINDKTKILSFDLEANGLHGEAFAVGAIVLDRYGNVHDEFTGRCGIIGKVDEWVEQNVLPVITDMDVTHSSYKHLRDNFWSWFVKAQKNSDYVLVNNGYPVEYRFLIQCQEDDIDSRYWEHPFPIIDMTSIIIAAGKDVQELKAMVGSEHKDFIGGSAHHPLVDAKVAALAAFKCFNQ